MPGGPCCWTGVCCDPPEATEALSAHVGIPLDAAARILARFQLVPLEIETGDEPVTAEHVALARKRLAKLHSRTVAELKAILIDMGHGV